jgi:hypothetical protein
LAHCLENRCSDFAVHTFQSAALRKHSMSLDSSVAMSPKWEANRNIPTPSLSDVSGLHTPNLKHPKLTDGSLQHTTMRWLTLQTMDTGESAVAADPQGRVSHEDQPWTSSASAISTMDPTEPYLGKPYLSRYDVMYRLQHALVAPTGAPPLRPVGDVITRSVITAIFR